MKFPGDRLLCLMSLWEQERDAIVWMWNVTKGCAEGLVPANDIFGGGAPVTMRGRAEAGHWEHTSEWRVLVLPLPSALFCCSCLPGVASFVPFCRRPIVRVPNNYRAKPRERWIKCVLLWAEFLGILMQWQKPNADVEKGRCSLQSVQIQNIKDVCCGLGTVVWSSSGICSVTKTFSVYYVFLCAI